MSIKLKIELLLAVLVFLIIIYDSIKKKKLTIKYSILWLFIIFVMILSAIFSNSLKYIASLIAIETTSNMIFLIVIGLLMFLCFNLTVIVSLHKQRIINLTQQLGIMENEMRSKNDKEDNKK